MPKQVDHEERRQLIAAALLRVVSRSGLEAVSLRHVGAAAGVTAGMVQHYFPTKQDMVQYAMEVASARYEQRITERLGRLGEDLDPSEIVRVLTASLIPTSTAEFEDARIALAFQSYAANNESAARHLGEGNRTLAGHIGELLASVGGGGADPTLTATALLATAEGLAVATLSSELSPDIAMHALDLHLSLLTQGRVQHDV